MYNERFHKEEEQCQSNFYVYVSGVVVVEGVESGRYIDISTTNYSVLGIQVTSECRPF
jgi:hypothetical protein